MVALVLLATLSISVALLAEEPPRDPSKWESIYIKIEEAVLPGSWGGKLSWDKRGFFYFYDTGLTFAYNPFGEEEKEYFSLNLFPQRDGTITCQVFLAGGNRFWNRIGKITLIRRERIHPWLYDMKGYILQKWVSKISSPAPRYGEEVKLFPVYKWGDAKITIFSRGKGEDYYFRGKIDLEKNRWKLSVYKYDRWFFAGEITINGLNKFSLSEANWYHDDGESENGCVNINPAEVDSIKIVTETGKIYKAEGSRGMLVRIK